MTNLGCTRIISYICSVSILHHTHKSNQYTARELPLEDVGEWSVQWLTNEIRVWVNAFFSLWIIKLKNNLSLSSCDQLLVFCPVQWHQISHSPISSAKSSPLTFFVTCGTWSDVFTILIEEEWFTLSCSFSRVPTLCLEVGCGLWCGLSLYGASWFWVGVSISNLGLPIDSNSSFNFSRASNSSLTFWLSFLDEKCTKYPISSEVHIESRECSMEEEQGRQGKVSYRRIPENAFILNVYLHFNGVHWTYGGYKLSQKIKKHVFVK